MIVLFSNRNLKCMLLEKCDLEFGHFNEKIAQIVKTMTRRTK